MFNPESLLESASRAKARSSSVDSDNGICDLISRTGRAVIAAFNNAGPSYQSSWFFDTVYKLVYIKLPASVTSANVEINIQCALQLGKILFYEPDAVLEYGSADEDPYSGLCATGPPPGSADASFWMEPHATDPTTAAVSSDANHGKGHPRQTRRVCNRLVFWPKYVDVECVKTAIQNTPDCNVTLTDVLLQIIQFCGAVARTHGWILRFHTGGIPVLNPIGNAVVPLQMGSDTNDPSVYDIVYTEPPRFWQHNVLLQSRPWCPPNYPRLSNSIGVTVTFTPMVYIESGYFVQLRETRKLRLCQQEYPRLKALVNEAHFMAKNLVLDTKAVTKDRCGFVAPISIGEGRCSRVYSARKFKPFTEDDLHAEYAVKFVFNLEQFTHETEITNTPDYKFAKRASDAGVGCKLYDAFWIAPYDDSLNICCRAHRETMGSICRISKHAHGVFVMEKLENTLEQLMEWVDDTRNELYSDGDDDDESAKTATKQLLIDECQPPGPEDADRLFAVFVDLYDKAGIVHCDAKPDNVGFTSGFTVNSQTGRVEYTWKLLDFNLSTYSDLTPESFGWTRLYPRIPEAANVLRIWDNICLLKYMQTASYRILNPLSKAVLEPFMTRYALRVHSAFAELYPEFGKLFPFSPARCGLDIIRFMIARSLLCARVRVRTAIDDTIPKGSTSPDETAYTIVPIMPDGSNVSNLHPYERAGIPASPIPCDFEALTWVSGIACIPAAV